MNTTSSSKTVESDNKEDPEDEDARKDNKKGSKKELDSEASESASEEDGSDEAGSEGEESSESAEDTTKRAMSKDGLEFQKKENGNVVITRSKRVMMRTIYRDGKAIGQEQVDEDESNSS